MGIRAYATAACRAYARTTARACAHRPTEGRNSFVQAGTSRYGYRRAFTLLGGEDANCVVTGPTIAGASRGIYCSGSSPTVSNCHFLRNLSVGMEGLPHATFRVGGPKLAGDTKPTIANSIFAAPLV